VTVNLNYSFNPIHEAHTPKPAVTFRPVLLSHVFEEQQWCGSQPVGFSI
jgi:hypothetical protein